MQQIIVDGHTVEANGSDLRVMVDGRLTPYRIQRDHGEVWEGPYLREWREADGARWMLVDGPSDRVIKDKAASIETLLRVALARHMGR